VLGSIVLQTAMFSFVPFDFSTLEQRVPVTELNFAKMSFNQANWISSRYQVRQVVYVRLKRSFRGVCSKKPEYFLFDVTFCNTWWVARIKIRLLKSSLVMRSHA